MIFSIEYMENACCWQCGRTEERIKQAFADDFFDTTPLLREVPVLGRFTGYSRDMDDDTLYHRNFKTATTYICVICRQQTYHVLFDQDLYPKGRRGKDWVKTAQGYVGIYNSDELDVKSRQSLQSMIDHEYQMIADELQQKFGHLWSDLLFERLHTHINNNPDAFNGRLSFEHLGEILDMEVDVIKQICVVSLDDSDKIEVDEQGIKIIDLDHLKSLLIELRQTYMDVVSSYGLTPELPVDEAFNQKREALLEFFYPEYFGQKQDKINSHQKTS